MPKMIIDMINNQPVRNAQYDSYLTDFGRYESYFAFRTG